MIRIVKMTFDPNKVDQFLTNFHENKQAIRDFEGVESLELLKDKMHSNVFFTYSTWKSPEFLEKYRNSALFQGIWAKTKPLFIEKAEAWSVETLVKLT